ncbi:MAG: FAD-dependent monooxygenase [Pigmentiphaga sp.]|uniref:FAD-dependent monooxygenase n=1 Tax=Pigmentiphaga sp. TaxID=1977564 RepID=UPI0029B5DB41|nr:FAD-dependent monooxygenase [Pigmentiphaga sp.]MDX3906028.1 FAD-dependent monooxygenase [Pigmentiphaga sp.]
METSTARQAGEVLIAGGGIGGVAAALALARRGYRARVLERSAELGEIGYGLQLGPNAYRMLEQFGVAGQLADKAFFPRNLRVRDAIDDRELTCMPLGDAFLARFGYPYCVIHRSDLHQILLDAVRHEPGVVIETSRAVDAFTQDADGVTVTCEDGSRYEGMALIGADGLRSRVRAMVLDDGAPCVAGQVAYRGVVPIEDVDDRSHADDVVLWVGPNLHLVQYRLKGGRVMNNVAVVEDPDLRAGRIQTIEPARMEQMFEVCSPSIRRMLNFVSKERHWVLHDRDPRPGWSRGRVTLLGDAAHPALQYMAQGACMALEDAHVLAQSLAGTVLPPDALQQYEAARFLRTARVQLTSRFFCRVCHAEGGARLVRNALLAQRPRDSYFEIDWLYRGI